MPYSSGPNDGDDIYHPDHGRYVLMASPGKGTMEFLGFSKVYYDKKDHTMRDKDESRADDFISISGSKMRKLAALGAKPCAAHTEASNPRRAEGLRQTPGRRQQRP